MPRHGKRVRVAKGIYRDKTGFAVVATVRGFRREQRLPLGLTLPELRGHRHTLIRRLEDDTPAVSKGTLEANVATYLKRLPEGSYKIDRDDLLAPWVEAFGTLRFGAITKPQIVQTLMAWEQAGLSPSTRNRRLSALRVLWCTIATDDALHPCERVKRARAPRMQRNRARPLALIAVVLEHVVPTTRKHKDAGRLAKAQLYAKHHLTLLAWTGQGAATLSRIRPEHVRWHVDPVEVYLQPRRKGSGVDAQWIPLLPQAAVALKAWLALNVTEPWHSGSIRAAWNRVIVKAQAALRKEERQEDAELLTGMRPYDCRHSFLTAMLSATGDAYAVSAYAQHSDIRTTMGYTQGASSVRMKAGLALLAGTVK